MKNKKNVHGDMTNFIYTEMNIYIKTAAFAILSFINTLTLSAQNPVANRVRAAAESLPDGCETVAKYTDNRYHCLFYTMHNRLYKYDVLTNKNTDVNFTPFAYSSIYATYLAPKGKYIYICIERSPFSQTTPENSHELWRISPDGDESKKIDEGIKIIKRKGCFIIKKLSRIKRVKDKNGTRRQWMMRDHYYNLDGHIIWAKDEYEYKK